MRNRYYLHLPDPAKARGEEPSLAFRSVGAEGMAEELEQALRTTGLFDRWRARQEDPDAVDPGMGAVDAQATVAGQQHDLAVDLLATTDLPGAVFKHRLRLLAGSGWQLRDVKAA
jgi:hypothetical protein